jgi:hypothetical protein
MKHFDETIDERFSRNCWWNILRKLLTKHFDETIDETFSRNCWWNILRKLLTKHFDETIDETFSQVEGSLIMHWIPQESLRTSPTIIPMYSTWMGLDRKPQNIHYQSDKIHMIVFPGTILPTEWRKQVILLVPSLVRAGDYDALISNEASKFRIHKPKYCKARRLNDRCNLTRAFEDVLQQIIISSRVGAHHAQLK